MPRDVLSIDITATAWQDFPGAKWTLEAHAEKACMSPMQPSGCGARALTARQPSYPINIENLELGGQ